MTSLVLVSHSRPLAEAALAAARELAPIGEACVAIAAGAPDGSLGTDPAAVQDAIERLALEDDVLVLTDIGSSVMAAETALELIAPELRDHVQLSAAPLVEGLFAAMPTAALGGDLAEVSAEAERAARLKGGEHSVPEPVPGPTPATGPAPADGDTMRVSFTLTNTHGLHARPAALLVAQVRTFDSHVRLRNVTTGGEWVDAGSVTQVTTLGASRGQQLELEASGPGAQRVLNAVVDLAKENFGEGSAPPPSEAAPQAGLGTSHQPRPDERLPASPGFAIGPIAHLVGLELTVPESDDLTPAERWEQLMAAFEATRGELRAAKAQSAMYGGPMEAAIFDAHILMLEDRWLLAELRERIDAGQGVAHAWETAMTTLVVRISKLEDPYLRSRASDAKGLRDQVLRHLLGQSATEVSGPGILVAGDLSPTEAASLRPDVTRGVVLAAGSPTSHSAIVARSLGVPMITGAGRALLKLPEGTILAIDGGTGRIELDPEPELVSEFERRIAARASALHSARRRAAKPAETLDGVAIPVYANIGSLAEAEAAVAAGADGSGLVRTEFLFADRTEAPSRDEQEDAYRRIAQAFDGRRVVIRTLDAGGDKPMEFLRSPLEANPFLGVRGVRLALRHPQVLLDQLSAICAVAEEYPISVMFPMVSDISELIQARRALAQAARERGRPVPPQLRVGIMVEVPAAALKGAAFAPLVDFFSIGTNDLTQYAMAAERGNPALAPLADPLDPALLRLIGMLCRDAKGRARVSVCGEMAADGDAIGFLLGLGVRSLSVPTPAIAEVKDKVRRVRISTARPLAGRAQRLRDAIAVRALVGGE